MIQQRQSFGKKDFVLNLLVMTLSMLFIKVISMGFNIYFTSKIGAEGIGMFHLIFSVYGFLVTFAVSGTSIACTRLICENGDDSPENGGKYSSLLCRSVVTKCMTIVFFASFLGMFFVFFFGRYFCCNVLGDEKYFLPVKILSVSLPWVGASSVFRGFFISVRSGKNVSASQIIEEIFSIFITMVLLQKLKGTKDAYLSLIVGTVSGTVSAVCYDFFVYRKLVGDNLKSSLKLFVSYRDIFKISMPIAIGSYLRTFLVSVENIAVTKKLSYISGGASIGEYGIIKGMAMPIMLFPTVFISSLATLLVPELAERKAFNMRNGIKYIGERAIVYTLYFSVYISLVFVMYHDFLGRTFYKNSSAGIYLGYLSLLVIPMYIDTVVDSMLKGLNEQMSSLRYNIIDSCLRVFLIFIIIPLLGSPGYIFILYISEIFNLSLSAGRLIKVTKIKPRLCWIVFPIIFGLLSVILTSYFNCLKIGRVLFFTLLYGGFIFVYEKCNNMKFKKIWKK